MRKMVGTCLSWHARSAAQLLRGHVKRGYAGLGVVKVNRSRALGANPDPILGQLLEMTEKSILGFYPLRNGLWVFSSALWRPLLGCGRFILVLSFSSSFAFAFAPAVVPVPPRIISLPLALAPAFVIPPTTATAPGIPRIPL